MFEVERIEGRNAGGGHTGPSWRLLPRDGRPLEWRDFSVGPVVLTASEIDAIGGSLLGLRREELPDAVRRELKPSVSRQDRPAVILYCATPLKKCFEADLSSVRAGGAPEEVATYIEARAVNLAGPLDLCVGRTRPWREAVAARGVRSLAVPGIEYYYMTHALLKQALAHGEQGSPVLDTLIGELRAAPDTVVRVYVLDDEMKLFLLWLRRAAGVPVLRVEANGSQVADRWSQKAPLHPTVETASRLAAGGPEDPFRLLAAETELTPFSMELGFRIPRLPGYTVEAAGAKPGDVSDQLVRAAIMLRERYGLRRGCLKPARAGTGARIRPGLPLDDHALLTRLGKEAAADGEEDYVLEAQADYVRHALGGHAFILAPSLHIQGGEPADGATLQIMNGTAWQGNVYFDEAVCERAGVSRDRYAHLRSQMALFMAAFAGRGEDMRLVKGGIDFAVTRVGGRFGDAVLVAMQDLNLLACGAEYLRLFLAEARRDRPGDDGARYAATKVVRPGAAACLATLGRHVEEAADGWCARVIASVPRRWGMIAVAAADPALATSRVLHLERRLAGLGLVTVSGPAG
ncbi:hypothetical protein [Thermoactinospora rubra]|uniref:hypothetical protein n=1 Tax=Thermoactinospora rubra TaxID=1088767 RepID=UPI000A12069C|nr:hypothetical protein [Thermoactinospora rubra]